MSATEPDYVVVSQVHAPKWFPELQRAVNGWTVTVRDGLTGVVVPIFCAEDQYTADNVHTLVEAALLPVRQVSMLGR